MKKKQQQNKIICMPFIVSTVICLLPIVFGLLKWNELPAEIAIHWDINGNPNSYGSRFAAVIITPVFLALLNAFYQIIIKIQMNRGMLNAVKLADAVTWLFPLLSLIISTIIYTTAMGLNLNVTMIISLFVGFVFTVIGNYLPKTGYVSSFRFGLDFSDTDKTAEKIKRSLGFVMVVFGLIMMIFSFTSFGIHILLASIVLLLVVYLIMIFIYRGKA